jgi:hypothetical protein
MPRSLGLGWLAGFGNGIWGYGPPKGKKQTKKKPDPDQSFKTDCQGKVDRQRIESGRAGASYKIASQKKKQFVIAPKTS